MLSRHVFQDGLHYAFIKSVFDPTFYGCEAWYGFLSNKQNQDVLEQTQSKAFAYILMIPSQKMNACFGKT